MTASETRTRFPDLDEAFEAELEAMALQAAAPPVEEPREPGLPRYLKWQALDFLKHRAAIMLPLAIIVLWIFRYNYDAAIVGENFSDAEGPRNEEELFRMILMIGGLVMGGIGSVLATFGIVSRDREGGHQRFLFAKPIRISSYYLQTFVVNGLGLLATAAVTLLLTSLVFMRAVPVVDPLLGVASTYVAVGGLTFLVSTLLRADLVIGGLVSLASIPMYAASRDHHWWAMWASLVSKFLPPLYNLIAFVPAAAADAPSRLVAVSSLVAYGAVCLAAGVAVLRRRSIIR